MNFLKKSRKTCRIPYRTLKNNVIFNITKKLEITLVLNSGQKIDLKNKIMKDAEVDKFKVSKKVLKVKYS